MGRVTWPVRVTYLPPLSLGAYKSGLSPHLGAPSGSSSGPVTASAHRVVSRHGMSRQDYAASEPDVDAMAVTFKLPLHHAARQQSFHEGRSYDSSQATPRGASTTRPIS